jgi:hypothetical protein
MSGKAVTSTAILIIVAVELGGNTSRVSSSRVLWRWLCSSNSNTLYYNTNNNNNKINNNNNNNTTHH